MADPEGVRLNLNPLPAPCFFISYENEIIWSQTKIMRYSRKMRPNQQSEPHTFIYMNPLSINPGSAPALSYSLRTKQRDWSVWYYVPVWLSMTWVFVTHPVWLVFAAHMSEETIIIQGKLRSSRRSQWRIQMGVQWVRSNSPPCPPVSMRPNYSFSWDI